MLRKGMFLADRYEIIEQIGTGGMSDVYKAKCHKLNRYVAIKVMKSEFSEDKTFVSKFRAEAQSVAGFTHPNVVNVYDVGDENGIYYIVMELVEGITLKKYIEKRGKLPFKEAVSIAIQVANGLDAAHKHHIVHRDIKPQNIIISKEGKVKVTDFGIAKVASSSTINSSSTMGSVHYISPEQARGGYSDERSDIYSLGITIFEMLTGTVPFDGDSTVAVAVQHIQDEIPAPSTVAADIPVSIDKIVLKCTQKKPDRRYQSAAELRGVLDMLNYNAHTQDNGKDRTAFGGDNVALIVRVCENIKFVFVNWYRKSQISKGDVNSSWRKYLLPGFRSLNIISCIAALIWYAVIVMLTFGLTVSDSKTGTPEAGGKLIIYKIAAFIIMLVQTLWFGNYLDVRRKLPGMKKVNAISTILTFVYAFVILFLLVMFLIIIMVIAGY